MPDIQNPATVKPKIVVNIVNITMFPNFCNIGYS